MGKVEGLILQAFSDIFILVYGLADVNRKQCGDFLTPFPSKHG
jgi:hypothetical protein